jgi:hypothetical protein
LEVSAKQERLEDRKHVRTHVLLILHGALYLVVTVHWNIVQRFEKKKQDLNLPDDYGVGDVDSGVNSHAAVV